MDRKYIELLKSEGVQVTEGKIRAREVALAVSIITAAGKNAKKALVKRVEDALGSKGLVLAYKQDVRASGECTVLVVTKNWKKGILSSDIEISYFLNDYEDEENSLVDVDEVDEGELNAIAKALGVDHVVETFESKFYTLEDQENTSRNRSILKAVDRLAKMGYKRLEVNGGGGVLYGQLFVRYRSEVIEVDDSMSDAKLRSICDKIDAKKAKK